MPGLAPNKATKFQRWVDLMAALLGRHSALVFEELVPLVPSYRDASPASAKRMFERDKAELRSLGVPIQTVGDDGEEESAYRIAAKDFYLPYLSVQTDRGLSRPRRVDFYGYRALAQLTFDGDELSAVAAAAARVRQLSDPALVHDVDSATRKLAFDLPLDAALSVQDVVIGTSRSPAKPEHLRDLSEALIARKRVVLGYHSMSRGESAVREVEPFGLFFLSSNWYLAARESATSQLKNFRVNRVRSVSMNAERLGTPDYEIPATFRLRDHAASRQAWELGADAAVKAVVEVRGDSGATIAAATLGQRVNGHPKRRRFDVRRPEVFIRWLLSFAGDMVPLEPKSICDEYRRQIASTLALYEGAPANT